MENEKCQSATRSQRTLDLICIVSVARRQCLLLNKKSLLLKKANAVMNNV